MSKFEEFESETKKIFGCACNILVKFNKKIFTEPSSPYQNRNGYL